MCKQRWEGDDTQMLRCVLGCDKWYHHKCLARERPTQCIAVLRGYAIHCSPPRAERQRMQWAYENLVEYGQRIVWTNQFKDYICPKCSTR